MKRKALALMLAAAMSCSMIVGCGGKSGDSGKTAKKDDTKKSQTVTPKNGGKKGTINLWAFTDEVPGMIAKYIDAHPDFPYKVT